MSVTAETRRRTADRVREIAGKSPGTWFLYLSARRAFGSDAELARVLEVHRSQIARWKRGQAADPSNEARLRNLGSVVDYLTGYLEAEAIPGWLSGVNPQLNHRRPIDLILSGRFSEVVAAIEAEKSGAFA